MGAAQPPSGEKPAYRYYLFNWVFNQVLKKLASLSKPTPHLPTTAQSLGALLKFARDILRKDEGLNGDLDRLPLLTWIMFLKFLDVLELQRAEDANDAQRDLTVSL